MKKSIFIGTLFLFFLIAIQSRAEMRIDPSGVTFPDSSTQTKAATGGSGDGLQMVLIFITITATWALERRTQITNWK